MPNVRIKTLGDNVACSGFFLEDGKVPGAMKLVPGEIVKVPDNFPIPDVLEITTDEATRPFNYKSDLGEREDVKKERIYASASSKKTKKKTRKKVSG